MVKKIKSKISNMITMRLFKWKHRFETTLELYDKLKVEKDLITARYNDLLLELESFKEYKNKYESAQDIISVVDRSIKEKEIEIIDLKKEINSLKIKNGLLNKVKFDAVSKYKEIKIQCEEYEKQIEDLKSDKYIVKKIKADKTKSKIKTTIQKPMKQSVVKFMKEIHE